MIPSNEGKNISKSFLAVTNETNAATIYFDTKGHDQLNMYIAAGTCNTQTAGISDINFYESDTVSTVVSSMSAIAAISSGTATSTAASNILPLVAVQKHGGIINEVQADLRKRKRYMACTVTTTTQAGGLPVSMVGRLSRNAVSADSATEKAGIDLGATNASGCMALISG